MKNVRTITGKLINLRRLPSSGFGNPRYELSVFDKENNTVEFIVTQVDAMHGYAVPNFEGREVVCEAGIHYGKLTLKTIKGN